MLKAASKRSENRITPIAPPVVKRIAKHIDRGFAWIAIKLIRLYQLTLSHWLGRQCRFYPTCSHYGREAFEVHGGIKGLWLTLKRVFRCHPFSKGGVDLVPDPVDQQHTTVQTSASDTIDPPHCCLSDYNDKCRES